MNETLLKGIILDLVNGIWREDELVEQTGLGTKRAKQVWEAIEKIRKEKK